MNDALPSSLMDLTMSPKVTIAKGEGIGARSLTCSILGVEGCVGDSKWGLRRLTSKFCTNQTTSWLVQNWSVFGAWTHKIHHTPNLWEATTFPLILLSMHAHGAST
jgi:hypothetical protein